jgi:signal transduction histidine kinase
VANLVDNAVRHTVPGGWLAVRTGVRDGRAVLEVENSGPVVDPHDVPALFEPFRRAGEPRVGRPDGLGVGLSIVSAVAAAHGAQLSTVPRPDGGLRIVVSFPLAMSLPPAGIPQRAAASELSTAPESDQAVPWT